MASSSRESEYKRGTVSGGMDNTYKVRGGAPGGVQIVDNGKRRAIYQDDGRIYYEDPEQAGRFRSHTRGSDYIDVDDYVAQAAAPAGGGGGGAPAASSGDWRDEVRGSGSGTPVDDQGKTTADILGDTYAAMTQFTPTTPGQVLNPLVNTNNWMTQVNPAMQVAYNDPGIYVNPQVGMLQDSWSNTSTNPYSLLG